MDFQIGDRVVLISEYADFRGCRKHDLPRGSIGTVCDVDHHRIGVDWDGCTNGHNCDGRLSSDSGWYVDDDRVTSNPLNGLTRLHTICLGSL